MGIDPQLNEQLLLDSLDLICTTQSAAQIQSGACLSLVDCFDRRINRDPFAEIVQSVCLLHELFGRLQVVAAVQKMVKDDKFTPQRLSDATKSLTQSAEAERHKIIKQMQLVSQCPRSWDKIN